MNDSPEYSGFAVSRTLHPSDLTENWTQEWLEKMDVKASVEQFTEMVNEEMQEACPGVVVEWNMVWEATDAKGFITVEAPADLDEEEAQEKSDAVWSALVEAYETVKSEYDWEKAKS